MPRITGNEYTIWAKVSDNIEAEQLKEDGLWKCYKHWTGFSPRM